MLKHVVLFKLKSEFSENDKKRRVEDIISALNRLPALIPEIKSFETGENVLPIARAYDLAVLARFDSLEALDIYTRHPEHQKVVELIAQSKENAVSVDFFEM